MRILSLVLCFGIAAVAANIRGEVRVRRSEKATPPSAVFVYAERLDHSASVTPGRFQLVQEDKMFHPHVLAIPVGSTVEFPNDDPIFHNVFSLSRPGPFDLGLYRAGSSRTHVFTLPAVYRIFCNIHPQMSAVILVLPTTYISRVSSSGEYHLVMPDGKYRITAWSEASQPSSTEVDVAGDVHVPELLLDESHYVELPHKNKFGRDYPPSAYDPLSPAGPH